MAVEQFGPGWAKRLGKQAEKKAAQRQVHQAQSQAQLEAVLGASKALEAKRYPEASEGLPCRTCGQRITGSLADVAAHRETHQ